jgi:transposase
MESVAHGGANGGCLRLPLPPNGGCLRLPHGGCLRLPPHPYTIYDYRDSRSRDGPAEVLKNFRGYLQTDAYASYESVVSESAGRIIPVGCWAHARREFYDARFNQPREAHYALGLIWQLYDIEDEVRLHSPEARLAARQEQSVPILDRLEKFLREQRDQGVRPVKCI